MCSHEVWIHETAALREFLVNLKGMLRKEQARFAEEAAARTGPFAEFNEALETLVSEWWSLL